MVPNSADIVVQSSQVTRRWVTRAIGLSFISLPFLLLLAWAVLAYLARYGADTVWNTVPALDWSDEALVRALANSNLPQGDRGRAGSVLARRSPRVIPLLVPLLDDDDPLTRIRAVQVIGRQGQFAGSVLPKILAMVDDPNPQVAASAMWAAVEIAAADKRVHAQIQKATRSSDVRVSQEAVRYLGGLKPVPIALVVRLMRHADPQTAFRAYNVFQEHSKDRREPQAVVREIDRWLESLSSPDKTKVGLVIDAYRTATADVLRRHARKHRARAMRLFALEELANLPNESLDEFIPELRRLAESNEPEDHRRSPIHLLGRIGPSGLSALRELRESPDEFVRFQSTLTLAGVEGTAMPTEEVISWFTTTRNKSIRRDCVVLLSSRPGEAARIIELLEPLGSNPNLRDDVKAAIIWVRHAARQREGQPESDAAP